MEHDEQTTKRSRELAEDAPTIVRSSDDIDWGDEQPDEVWLDLYEQGLVRPPYRRPNSHELDKPISEWEPLNFKGTTEDILRALGREIEPDGVEPGGTAAAEAVHWHEDDPPNLGAQSPAHQRTPDPPSRAVLPPRVQLKGTTEDILRALGLPIEAEAVQQSSAAAPETIDWGDAEPDPVWLDLYEQGLVRPPYRGPNSHEIAKIIAERKPIHFKGRTNDILRALGRL